MSARADHARLSLAVDLGLPRVTGGPEDIAVEIQRRALAKLNGFVYVGAYIRRRPRRRRPS